MSKIHNSSGRFKDIEYLSVEDLISQFKVIIVTDAFEGGHCRSPPYDKWRNGALQNLDTVHAMELIKKLMHCFKSLTVQHTAY